MYDFDMKHGTQEKLAKNQHHNIEILVKSYSDRFYVLKKSNTQQ